MQPSEKLFDAVRALPPDEHDAYLKEACPSAEQRAEVEAMLADASDADGYFANIDTATGATPIAEKPGDTIGPYKLLQKIGEGGFGVVFMAEQRQPIVRRVALKIIKQGMDTRQVIARFEAERQALAMMDHAHVARVLDAGATDTGRPFFAMELVRGEPITEFCDAHALDTRQRLDLFLDVCSAVNHAHQKGIIHRDLKPSNILVGLDADTPVVKVIDFGIAKAIQQNLTDKTLFTRFEQFLGTPAYVSPEQASLSPIDVDTRSDIYSLGVVLYELLAGRPPIDTNELKSAGFDEMRRLIREKEAPKPSTRLNTCTAEERHTIAKNRHTEPRKLGLLIKGDLDWVVLKSLEKDRQRRYETANALSGDIRSFLTDQPVSAVAPSTTYRLRKLVRRNRTTFAAAAAITLALVVGLAVSLTSLHREKQSRQRAESSEQSSRQLSSAFQRVLASIGPAIAQSSDTELGRQMLDKIVQPIENDLPNNTPQGVEIRLEIGKIYAALGQADNAKTILTDALAGARTLRDNSKTIEVLIELAQAERDALNGDPSIRLKRLQEAIDLSEKTHGPDHPHSILPLSRLASHIGGTKGIALARSANERAERSLAQDDPVRAIVFANLYSTTSVLLSAPEELAMYRQLSDNFSTAFGDDHPESARTQFELAYLLYRTAEATGQSNLLEEAIELAQKTDKLMRRIHQVGYHRRVEARWVLAIIQLATSPEEIGPARTAWTEALAEQRLSVQHESDSTIHLRIELAWALHRQGLTTEANKIATAFTQHDTPPNWVKRKWANHSFARNEWDLARADLQQLTSDESNAWDIDWMKLAALHLHLDNREAYDQVRISMANRNAESTAPQKLERTAKVYFAAPVDQASPLTKQVYEHARRTAANAKEQRSWRYLALGMAQVRTGRAEQAINTLQSAAAVADETDYGHTELNLLALIQTYRTLAEAAAGHPAEAKASLAKAETAIAALPPDPDFHGWNGIIFARTAYKEAQQIVNGH